MTSDPAVSPASERRFLAGRTVLEVGDGIAGGNAGMILAALGADVVSIVVPGRRHRRPHPGSGRGASVLSSILDRGKRTIEKPGLRAIDLERVIAQGVDGRPFDVVVVDRVERPGFLTDPLTSAGHAAFVETSSPRAWVTISAFGLTGDRGEEFASELTVGAAAGLLGSVHEASSRRPMKLAGNQSLVSAGQAAALAACHAIDLARNEERVHLDLSAVEATIATGPVLEIAAVLLNAGGPGGAQRYGAPASFYPCRDGLIRISAMEDHQWRGVVDAMGSPAWTLGFSTTDQRIEGAREIDDRMAAWTRGLSKFEAERLLQSHGVPATAVYSAGEALDSPQLRFREALDSFDLGGRPARIVGLPFRTLPPGPSRVRARREPTLRGLRVLEASHVLAVPLAGALLGALGAEVIKLEDTRRLDMYRRRGPYVDGEPGANRSAYFTLVNHSKSSTSFDVDSEPDRLAALLDECDVLIENLGGRRAERFGVAVHRAIRDHPHLLAVSSSGFGQEGPFASYRAYAYNLQASCCLGALTHDRSGETADIDLPWADLISAYCLATLVAAWAIGTDANRGIGVDFAMSDLVIGRFNEFVAQASLSMEESTFECANDNYPFAPNGVYATEDGWIAMSVHDDHAYSELVDTLGGPPRLRDEKFGTVDGRYSARRELDALIEQSTREWAAEKLALTLRDRSMFAESVVAPRELPASSYLAERGFFTAVDHPELGVRRLIGLPWRPYGGPPIALAAPPVLAGRETGRPF